MSYYFSLLLTSKDGWRLQSRNTRATLENWTEILAGLNDLNYFTNVQFRDNWSVGLHFGSKKR